MPPKQLYQRLKTTKWNLKKTVELATFQKPQLQSVLIFYKFVHPYVLSFLFNVLFSPSLIFSALILYFTQFDDSSLCLNFDKSRDETPAFNKVGSWSCHYIRYCTYNLLWTKFGIWKGRNSRLSRVAARTGDSKLLVLLISKRIRFDGAGRDLKRALR